MSLSARNEAEQCLPRPAAAQQPPAGVLARLCSHSVADGPRPAPESPPADSGGAAHGRAAPAAALPHSRHAPATESVLQSNRSAFPVPSFCFECIFVIKSFACCTYHASSATTRWNWHLLVPLNPGWDGLPSRSCSSSTVLHCLWYTRSPAPTQLG